MPAARQPRQPAGAISTILLGLRRAPRQIRRGSRDVIETAVSQLFDAAVQPHGVAASGEYRIEELARLAGTTTRNIRVYRDRGLLHPPLRVGRIALVQRHAPDAVAADHLPARPWLQHRPRARDAVRLGAGQGRRRHARAGICDRGQLGHREARADERRGRQTTGRRRPGVRAFGRPRSHPARGRRGRDRATQAHRGVQRHPPVRRRHRQAHRSP